MPSCHPSPPRHALAGQHCAAARGQGQGARGERQDDTLAHASLLVQCAATSTRTPSRQLDEGHLEAAVQSLAHEQRAARKQRHACARGWLQRNCFVIHICDAPQRSSLLWRCTAIQRGLGAWRCRALIDRVLDFGKWRRSARMLPGVRVRLHMLLITPMMKAEMTSVANDKAILPKQA